MTVGKPTEPLAEALAWLASTCGDPRIAACGCAHRWGSYGRLYGVSMGDGWIRTETNPDCPEHGHNHG